MRHLGLVAMAAMLAGCAAGQGTAPVERRTVVSGAGFEAVRGEADLVVRTFLDDGSQQRMEVVGARCTVSTSLYSAKLGRELTRA